MAFLYITEHTQLPQYQGSNTPAPEMPPLATQRIDNTGATTQSAVFNSKARVIGLHTDSICSVEFGVNPTATTSSRRLAANSTEYFSIPSHPTVNGAMRLAVILNT